MSHIFCIFAEEMQPLDTYKKNRKCYVILGRDGDKVFAYPRDCVGQGPRPAYYRKWWNIRMCYYRTYRELSQDFKDSYPRDYLR